MSTPVKYSPDAIEIELIRSLYDGLLPSLVMSLGFLICGALIIEQSGDMLIAGPYAIGVLASIARLLVASRDAAAADNPAITLGEARRLDEALYTAKRSDRSICRYRDAAAVQAAA
ncbi:hypothetical protein [Sphingopyxis macrogoltabida]|jgi:hypothetical protein|uniref:Uncharacterized protein n=1 Tax=Sphingopyxis macrogoltabida TaxID=33050 RepID=A0AAC9AUV8_SPHMC|nr:hypothetical protein [Sphingopyxis macrogoltabida]ALJ13419.1 hypothetical protein LH19_11120 [Sphingopyxis macrogoltabida]AMU89117.1 hypothetical protein ATM17_08710 [Sphingopyxis macrogoltabida]